jgi:hypothetical protein
MPYKNNCTHRNRVFEIQHVWYEYLGYLFPFPILIISRSPGRGEMSDWSPPASQHSTEQGKLTGTLYYGIKRAGYTFPPKVCCSELVNTEIDETSVLTLTSTSQLSWPNSVLRAELQMEQASGFASVTLNVAGSIPDEVTEFFNLHNPSTRTMALRSTRPLPEISTRNILGSIFILLEPVLQCTECS